MVAGHKDNHAYFKMDHPILFVTHFALRIRLRII